VRVEDCSGLGLTSAYWGLSVASGIVDQDMRRVAMSSSGPNGPYRIETARGITEWIVTDPPFPVLSAKLPDGVTPWSLRDIWFANDVVTPAGPFYPPQILTLNRLAAGNRKITVELFVPSGQDFSPFSFIAVVQYTGTDGKSRSEQFPVPVASSAVWANAASYPGYVAKKIELAETAYPIMANSLVSVQFRYLNNPTSGAMTHIYRNPGIGIV
jgi:hypothetical protein